MDEKYYRRIIAMNLKRLAYDHDKTQAQISRDLGINKQTLSTWMNGDRTTKQLYINPYFIGISDKSVCNPFPFQ